LEGSIRPERGGEACLSTVRCAFPLEECVDAERGGVLYEEGEEVLVLVHEGRERVRAGKRIDVLVVPSPDPDLRLSGHQLRAEDLRGGATQFEERE
jgi:hypothetical protein